MEIRDLFSETEPEFERFKFIFTTSSSSLLLVPDNSFIVMLLTSCPVTRENNSVTVGLKRFFIFIFMTMVANPQVAIIISPTQEIMVSAAFALLKSKLPQMAKDCINA